MNSKVPHIYLELIMVRPLLCQLMVVVLPTTSAVCKLVATSITVVRTRSGQVERDSAVTSWPGFGPGRFRKILNHIVTSFSDVGFTQSNRSCLNLGWLAIGNINPVAVIKR